MAYRLPSERVPVTVDDLTIEVERCASFVIQQRAAGLSVAFFTVTPQAQVRALRDAYEFFVAEAQPTWEIVDHRGPVLPTVSGMLRLDPALGLALIEGWAETLTEPASVADELLPPGPLRDRVKAELKAKRKKG